MTAPLKGIRVVELTTMITGPMTGQMLADLGADVVKVEQPEGGDPFRSFRGGLYSPHFCGYNRNKRSITLDLRAEAGAGTFRKLIERSDILIDNVRAGGLERLGFGDVVVRSINPKLVHCSITGFGADGPYANRPAYDAIAQALSGMSSLFLDTATADITGPTTADNVTAHVACQGILAALVGLGRGHAPLRVEVNMLEATIASFMADPFGYLHQMGLVSDPKLRPRTSQSYAFVCKDMKLIAVHLSSQEKFWKAFATSMGREELLSDTRFATRPDRIENYAALHLALAKDFLLLPRAAWFERLSEAGLPVAPIYDVSEVESDPQIRHLQTFCDVEHPTEGRVRTIRRPLRFEGQRDDQPLSAPPTLGEHTAEILCELEEDTDSARL
ncbi:CoA transferase [Bradyrhizobium sp. 190]|nr:CoA transferase [Bradyrhizobium sp. 190]